MNDHVSFLQEMSLKTLVNKCTLKKFVVGAQNELWHRDLFTPKIPWPISISLLLYVHVRSKEQSFQFCSFVKLTRLYQSVNEPSFIYTHKRLMLWSSSKTEERFGTKDDSNRSYRSLKEKDTAYNIPHMHFTYQFILPLE